MRAKKTLLDAATFDLFRDSKEAPVQTPVRMSQEAPKPERSVFSKLTFGVFDDEEKQEAPAQ